MTPGNGQFRALAYRIGGALLAFIIGLLGYLAVEVRADVRGLQSQNTERRLQIEAMSGDLRAVKATVERIERKIDP